MRPPRDERPGCDTAATFDGMDSVDGRTAVVVGGGSGVGRGTCLALNRAGARLAVADIELHAAESVADELRRAGGDALAVHVDGTDRDSLGALADTTEAAYGSIDVFANNVGVIVDAPLVEATEQQWAWVIEFNLMSIVRGVSVFAPRMIHDDGAHIVNTASMAALFAGTPEMVGGVHLGLYTATKHALLGYSEILRSELAADGIGVSVLCPGLVDSNLMATSLRNRPDRYGGAEEISPITSVVPGAMSQEDAGAAVVKGIVGNRLHILTHPESQPIVDARHAALVADFEFFRSGA